MYIYIYIYIYFLFTILLYFLLRYDIRGFQALAEKDLLNRLNEDSLVPLLILIYTYSSEPLLLACAELVNSISLSTLRDSSMWNAAKPHEEKLLEMLSPYCASK